MCPRNVCENNSNKWHNVIYNLKQQGQAYRSPARKEDSNGKWRRSRRTREVAVTQESLREWARRILGTPLEQKKSWKLEKGSGSPSRSAPHGRNHMLLSIALCNLILRELDNSCPSSLPFSHDSHASRWYILHPLHEICAPTQLQECLPPLVSLWAFSLLFCSAHILLPLLRRRRRSEEGTVYFPFKRLVVGFLEFLRLRRRTMSTALTFPCCSSLWSEFSCKCGGIVVTGADSMSVCLCLQAWNW